ncbi:MAG: 50S ribosomal protein L13, partial [Candidatus Micrarchaeaceae archaeon]
HTHIVIFMADYVIDGEDKILGRIGSYIAKELLKGNAVTLVNAEKISVSGGGNAIFMKYKRLLELKDKANPEHSPYWSRRPDLFVKRVIRGMLPYKKPRGKEAYKRLKVYVGVPKGIDGKAQKVESKSQAELYQKAMTVGELTAALGYKK